LKLGIENDNCLRAKIVKGLKEGKTIDEAFMERATQEIKDHDAQEFKRQEANQKK
jgi:hypothetical protein